MKNTLIVAATIVSLLSGCAGMSKGQQTALGGVGGCAAGAALGILLGGGAKNAAIGCGAGAALGAATAYMLANDPYTQSVTQQANAWQQETGASTEVVKASQVVENGQNVQRIDSQKVVVPNEKMVSGKHLAPKAKQQLVNAKSQSAKVGGNVHVICPASATKTVLNDISNTGVTYTQEPTMQNGYVVVMSRNNEGVPL